MDNTVYNEPSETEAVEGNVALMGPDGVSVMLTPDAAIETSERLLNTAMTAQGQRAEGQRKANERRALFGDDSRA